MSGTLPQSTAPQDQPAAPQDQSAARQSTPTFADLLRAMFRLSRPNVPAPQFYPAFLKSLAGALHAPSVCVWCATAETFQVLAHHQLEQVGMRPDSEAWATHLGLLTSIARGKKPARIQPGQVTEAGTNPLNMELFCVPFTVGKGVRFVVEVFSAASLADPARPLKGRLARLHQLCEFLQDYLTSQELKQHASQAEVESKLRAFVTRLNAIATFNELAVVAVNEGRQTIGCERVSLGWLSGRHPRILSVSGHDTIDPRSNVIRALVNLTKSATQSGVALKTSFPPAGGEATQTSPLTNEKSVQNDKMNNAYQSAMDSYPTTDRPRHLLVIPIGESNELSKLRGALIVEQFESDALQKPAIQLAAFVADQIRLPLQRLELLESVPFLSWWSRPNRRPWSRRIWRLLLLTLVLGAVGGLACLPMELRLSADGDLLAETRHAVFAPENGVVREVHVDHGSRVRTGDPLLTLDNLDLSAQLRDLTGQLVQMRERQRSLEAKRSGARLTEREQLELQSGLVEAASSAEHTERQIKLLQERMDRLRVVAPADGIVTSWNVKQTLLHRTVLPGDALLQEIEPTGRWMIELRIPEDRAGYVVRHLSELPTNESFKVEFVLATEPERRYPGLLRNIAARTELTADGHIVRAVIELDPENLPPLRDGAEVKARLHCGPQRAGFVWFRELIEVIQTYWWY